jgi:hypothetical protein
MSTRIVTPEINPSISYQRPNNDEIVSTQIDQYFNSNQFYNPINVAENIFADVNPKTINPFRKSNHMKSSKDLKHTYPSIYNKIPGNYFENKDHGFVIGDKKFDDCTDISYDCYGNMLPIAPGEFRFIKNPEAFNLVNKKKSTKRYTTQFFGFEEKS